MSYDPAGRDPRVVHAESRAKKLWVAYDATTDMRRKIRLMDLAHYYISVGQVRRDAWRASHPGMDPAGERAAATRARNLKKLRRVK